MKINFFPYLENEIKNNCISKILSYMISSCAENLPWSTFTYKNVHARSNKPISNKQDFE